MYFVIFDRGSNLNEYYTDEWYKKHITERDTIWIGNGLNRQLRIQCNNITKDAIQDDFAFVITSGRAELIKIPVQNEEGDE